MCCTDFHYDFLHRNQAKSKDSSGSKVKLPHYTEDDLRMIADSNPRVKAVLVLFDEGLVEWEQCLLLIIKVLIEFSDSLIGFFAAGSRAQSKVRRGG